MNEDDNPEGARQRLHQLESDMRRCLEGYVSSISASDMRRCLEGYVSSISACLDGIANRRVTCSNGWDTMPFWQKLGWWTCVVLFPAIKADLVKHMKDTRPIWLEEEPKQVLVLDIEYVHITPKNPKHLATVSPWAEASGRILDALEREGIDPYQPPTSE